MRKLAAFLAAAALTVAMLQPVARVVNDVPAGSPELADGGPVPPFPPKPGVLSADGGPVPPFPPKPKPGAWNV